jgi:hypothetical protein
MVIFQVSSKFAAGSPCFRRAETGAHSASYPMMRR